MMDAQPEKAVCALQILQVLPGTHVLSLACISIPDYTATFPRKGFRLSLILYNGKQWCCDRSLLCHCRNRPGPRLDAVLSYCKELCVCLDTPVAQSLCLSALS